MFVHAVYFWLRDDISPGEEDRFVAGLQSLRAIETVSDGWIGLPGQTDRPVVDRSWTWGLVLTFADQAAHDAYQRHPVHDRFRAECGGYWRTVRIYDLATPRDAARPA